MFLLRKILWLNFAKINKKLLQQKRNSNVKQIPIYDELSDVTEAVQHNFNDDTMSRQ